MGEENLAAIGGQVDFNRGAVRGNLAKRNGIGGSTAEVLRDNRRMPSIFNHSGRKAQSRLEGDVFSFRVDF